VTYTYDPSAWPGGQPPPLEAVRLLLGDTDERSHEVQDEEILAILAQSGGVVVRAAYEVARTVHGRLSRRVDESGAGLQVSRSQRHMQWQDVLRRLERTLAESSAPVPVYSDPGHLPGWLDR
jgi:hypothetical protein